MSDRPPPVRPRFDPLILIFIAISGLTLLFLIVPQISLLIRGSATRGWEGLPRAGVSEAIALSLFTTFLSTLITLLFGTPLAYLLARYRFPLRRLLIVFVELPIVLPPTVAGLALLITLGRRGFLGSTLADLRISLPFTTAAVVLAQVFVSAPFYIRAAQNGFQSVSKEIESAARVDGADTGALFFRIMLPLSGTALASGLTLSWARALGEFGATILFAGSSAGTTRTLTLLVYNLFESNIDAAIWSSVILLGLAFIALLLSQYLSTRTESE